MSIENVIYAIVAAVIGVMGTIITSLIKERRSRGRGVDESQIKSSIEKIVTEFNVDNVHFYILNDNKKFSTEKDMKFKFKSKGAIKEFNEGVHAYQVRGRSGRVGVFIANMDCEGLKDKIQDIARFF